MTLELTNHERRILSYLEQHGPTRRDQIVRDLAHPDSKIGRCRDGVGHLGGGSSSNGEALIMGAWCKRLTAAELVRQVQRDDGYYRHHEITPAGRAAWRRVIPGTSTGE